MSKPYSIYLVANNGDKILHTNLIFYHIPIVGSVIASILAQLNCCEWLIVTIMIFLALAIFPISFIIRNSRIVSEIQENQVKNKEVNRISSSLLSGFLELIHIIFAIIMTIVFLTILIYYFEKEVNTNIPNLNSAIDFSLFALDIKGVKQVALETRAGKIISVILWGISQVLLAIIIGFWINSFRHIFLSFKE